MGVLHSDVELRDALVDALGPEAAFREELHHRSEHSIELASVWLHHARGGEQVKLLPVLCGHPGPFLAAGGLGEGLGPAVALLRHVVEDGALVVVAGDLAHVGPRRSATRYRSARPSARPCGRLTRR
jgi:AmmeMemoRadiSam system protein B